jgi:hypothetical protein
MEYNNEREGRSTVFPAFHGTSFLGLPILSTIDLGVTVQASEESWPTPYMHTYLRPPHIGLCRSWMAPVYTF